MISRYPTTSGHEVPRGPRLSPWRRPPQGFTLLEIIVALAISLTFFTALYSSFNQVLRSTSRTRARVEAVRNGRSAIATMLDDIKTAQRSGGLTLFVGTDSTRAFGNGIDEDNDGNIDEEVLDGTDDETPPDYTAGPDDNHATIAGFGSGGERFAFIGVADLGDFHVDEDVRFGNDTLSFRRFPGGLISNEVITYSVEDSPSAAPNTPRVLMRSVATLFTDTTTASATTPLAFGVHGLDLLYWDQNATPPTWTTTWDSSVVAGTLTLPVSVYIRLTLHGDTQPLQTYTDGQEIRTVHMQMIVNVEDILTDAAYDALRP